MSGPARLTGVGGAAPGPTAPAERRAELAARLAAVEQRVQAACAAAGRRRTDLTLIAVSKTWPASDVALLHGLGLGDFGENRDADAAEKARLVPAVRWHFVGQLQTNKARSVAAYADVVHSVDRASLVAALSAGAVRAARTVQAFVQVDLGAGGAAGRGGASPDAVPGLADLVVGAAGLELAGVMAVAPRDADPAAAFAMLALVSARVRDQQPGAVAVSAGMSGDLEQAVAAGATHLRVGTALFGHRGLLTR